MIGSCAGPATTANSRPGEAGRTNEPTGCGPVLHNDPRERPPETFAGTTKLDFGRGKAPFVRLPFIAGAEKPEKAVGKTAAAC